MDDPQMPPLSEPLPSLPIAVYAKPPKSDPFKTSVTTLPSGIKVASEAKFGEYCTIGVVIDAGSRYEVAYPSGICHFLEKLAFNSTENYESKDELYAELERHGGICDAQCTKDTFLYAASCLSSGMDSIVGLLADAVLRPKIQEDELDLARTVVNFDIEDMNTRPDCEMILTDWIHKAAYRDNTLGLPKYCSEKNVDKISREILFSFMKTYYAPRRMVFAGIGVAHEDLVVAVKKYFEGIPSVWNKNPGLTLADVDESVSQYTGGLVKIDQAAEIVVEQFLGMAKTPQNVELGRAKTQLQSMLMMNLEQRPVMFEDVGRQVLGHGHRKSPMEYLEEIEKVGAKDIVRIGERLLSSKAAVVGYGKLDKLPSYEKIDRAIARKETLNIGRKRFSIFGSK